MRRPLAWLLIVPVGLGVVGFLALLDVGGTTDGSTSEATDAGPTTTAASGPTTTAGEAPPDAAAMLAAARAADGPSAVAGVIVASEAAVRDPETPDDQLAEWGAAQQLGYRVLARHPDWDAEVAELVAPDLREVVEANVRAHRELFALTEPRTELPDWRIVPPPPAEELLAHYRAAGEEFGVEWEYLAAIHLVETRMGRIRGASTAGARGPMQFIPATWAAYGEGDIEDPGDAIRAAARYLVDHGAPDDMDAALWAYNHSDRYVAAVQAHAGVMAADERAYRGYYHWQVYYRLQSGDVRLPVGWTLEDGHPEEE